MNLLLALTIGVMVGVGVMQTLRRDLFRLIVGFYILWNAINLLLLGAAGTAGQRAPYADPQNGAAAGQMADPLAQAVILTAIIITFGFTAFLLMLFAWLSRRRGSIDVHDFDQEKG